jgi:nickel-type superoxide dismutase maturation protease
VPESGPLGGGWRRRLRSRRLVVVDGSMLPTLRPGDRLLVDAAPLRAAPPGVGEIVALSDPEAPSRILIKRVAGHDGPAGTVSVLGDARESSRDSRAFGPVPLRLLLGVVWFRYLPMERRGPLAAAGPEAGPKP